MYVVGVKTPLQRSDFPSRESMGNPQRISRERRVKWNRCSRKRSLRCQEEAKKKRVRKGQEDEATKGGRKGFKRDPPLSIHSGADGSDGTEHEVWGGESPDSEIGRTPRSIKSV